MTGLTDYSRQEDIVTPRQLAGRPFHVIGCGGIGSNAAPALARLGVRHFVLWDPDVVEAPNLPNQSYRPADIGRPKAEALADQLSELGVPTVEVHVCRYQGNAELKGIVLAAVDSIAARTDDIWPHVRYNPFIELFFDGRLGGEQLRLLTVQPNDAVHVEGYERTLFKPEHAAQLPCGSRSVIGPALGLAMLITGQLTKYVSREPYPNSVRFTLERMRYESGTWA